MIYFFMFFLHRISMFIVFTRMAPYHFLRISQIPVFMGYYYEQLLKVVLHLIV